MYRKVEDFLIDWERDARSTHSLLNLITDEKLDATAFEGGYSISGLAWHIVWNAAEIAKACGAELPAEFEIGNVPKTAKEIADAYRGYSYAALKGVSAYWNDDALEGEAVVWGRPQKRGKYLSESLLHQAHHRGQLSALMRFAGLPVVGVYGPSREEWAQYGIPSPGL
ncbi:MAG: DinB family protein [Chloroflexota bacterium]